MLSLKDLNGITVAQAFAKMKKALPKIKSRPLGGQVAAFVEAHVEQGTVLETNGNTIGVVTGIQATRDLKVEVFGEENHAGTTPRKRRKDALLEAVRIVERLDHLYHNDPEDTLRFTVGRFIVTPNAPSVVPGYVLFTIDSRHPNEFVLDWLGDQVVSICDENAESCKIVVTEVSRTPFTKFDDLIIEKIISAAKHLGLSYMHILSGASHDAGMLARICPSGMIFVPSEKGYAHSEKEYSTPSDLAAGARVLANVIVELANR
jgi:N-carbamoyl-L-amino-acid hydrolase